MRDKHIPVKKLYFMMNKSAGTVCSRVSDSHKTVFDDFPPEILIDKNGAKLHTVGRLDADTEGLLLLTNDGNLSNFLTRPENKIERIYLAVLKNQVLEDEQKIYSEKARNGILLPPEKKFGWQESGPAFLEWISGNECKITLTEGKFHEVKRIFRALGNEVVHLKRIKFAGFSLPEDLESGEWREIKIIGNCGSAGSGARSALRSEAQRNEAMKPKGGTTDIATAKPDRPNSTKEYGT